MKKNLIIIFVALCAFTNAQNSFSWERIDSTDKTKEQLYSLTKEFITTNWRSPKDVIQLDDKEGGTIILKGLTKDYTYTFLMNRHDFVYQYSMKFYFKEKKYKVQIDNVICYSHTCGGNNWGCIDPVEHTDHKIERMPVDMVNEMMGALKSDLNALFILYNNFIYSAKANKEW